MAGGGASRRRAERRRAGDRGVLLRLGLLLATCGLAALVVSLLALPVVGGVGLLAKAGADTFEELPAELTDPVLAQRSVIYDKTGTKLAELKGDQDRVIVTIDQVPDLMQKAIIGIEDARFYEHHGVDFQGVARAFVRNGQSSGPTQGGSTITQQYVKNALQNSAHNEAERMAATEQSFQRKLREARYALELERRLTKKQILERYLNIAYFGDGVYGVGTAAAHYFHVRVESLNLAQAAMLAGLVNSPSRYNPFDHPVAATQRRNLVLTRMGGLGFITPDQEQRARGVAVPRRGAVPTPADACEGTAAPFFCDYVRTTLRNDPKLGDDRTARDRAVYEGGLQVRTTLDPAVQKAAQAAVDHYLPHDDRVLAVLAVVEPGTGKVLAIAANRTYDSSKKPGTTKIGVGYTPLGFNPGSTFKMFTMVTALKQALPVSTRFFAKACYTSTVFDNPKDPKPGSFCPEGFQNAGDEAESGTFDLASGTWFSVNTYFIQLEEKVGLDNLKQTVVDMGVPRSRIEDAQGSLTLGGLSDGVTPIDLATAYATLAAHGVECDPRPISTVTDPASRPVEVTHVGDCHRVLDAAVADTATGILEGVLTQKGATAAGKGLVGRVAAGKTGTTDNETAAWFAGFTPQLAMAVGLGDPTAPSTELGTVQGVNPVYGGTIPASIWQEAMNGALADEPAADLPPPVGTGIVQFGAPKPAAPASPSPSSSLNIGALPTKADGALPGQSPGAGRTTSGRANPTRGTAPSGAAPTGAPVAPSRPVTPTRPVAPAPRPSVVPPPSAAPPKSP